MQSPRTGRRADLLGEGNGAAHVAPRPGGQEVPGPPVAALLRRRATVPARAGTICSQGRRVALTVARHKEVFFPAAWARYADAKPGTLRLVPPDVRLSELEQDYRKMREMIFGEQPAFEHLLEVLREIERHVNGG